VGVADPFTDVDDGGGAVGREEEEDVEELPHADTDSRTAIAARVPAKALRPAKARWLTQGSSFADRLSPAP